MNERVDPVHVRPAADDFVASALAKSCALECEQVVLGVLLVAPGQFQPVSYLVGAEDFSEPLHQQIFACMADLAADGKPISFMLVKACLGDRDCGTGMTMGAYLARLASEAPVVAGVVEYARTVREMALRRKMIELAMQTIAKAAAAPVTQKSAGIASEAVAALDEIASANLPSTMRRVGLGDAAIRAVEAGYAARDGKAVMGLPTGLTDLDAVLGGLQKGQGSVLAGRPSMGKTAIALEIALNVARTKRGVFYVSLEMGDISLAQRALSSLAFDDVGQAPIPYFRLAKGKVTNAELDRLERAAGQLGEWPFIIDQQPHLNVSQITARIRQAKLQMEAQGTELGLVVVDHLGLVAASNRYRGDRVREIGEISGGLHALARECDVHVMMLSQLNRSIESREDKRPQMHDLRESGEIEQNADLILGVFREAYYLQRQEQTAEVMGRLSIVENQVEVGVLKNRQGPTAQVPLFADMANNAIRGLQ